MELGAGPSESFGAQEGGSGVPEQLSEEAKQRFAASAAAMQQIRREEKKARKKDDRVAQVIVKFLAKKDHAHLFLLISRLVARDCPSIFILSIVSLIDDESLAMVDEHLTENGFDMSATTTPSTALIKDGSLDDATNADMIRWIERMQSVLSLDAENILLRLTVDEKNIDGSVLQLTAFVLQEFFRSRDREAPFEKIQPLTAGILQTVFEPFMKLVRKKLLETKEEDQG